jgi:hypothetical protein
MRPSISFDLKARDTRSISALWEGMRTDDDNVNRCNVAGVYNNLSLSSRELKTSDNHAMTRDLSQVFQSVEERHENKRLKSIPSSLSWDSGNCTIRH